MTFLTKQTGSKVVSPLTCAC